MSECYVCGQPFTAASRTRKETGVPLCITCTPPVKETPLPTPPKYYTYTTIVPQVKVQYYRVKGRASSLKHYVDVHPTDVGVPGFTEAEIREVVEGTLGTNAFPSLGIDIRTKVGTQISWEPIT